MAVLVIAAAAVFAFGIAAGIIVVVAVAVRREDRQHTLAAEPVGRMSRNARRLTGLSCRDLDGEFLRPVPAIR